MSLGGPWGERKARPYLAWGSTGDGVKAASLSRPLGSLGGKIVEIKIVQNEDSHPMKKQ